MKISLLVAMFMLSLSSTASTEKPAIKKVYERMDLQADDGGCQPGDTTKRQIRLIIEYSNFTPEAAAAINENTLKNPSTQIDIWQVVDEGKPTVHAEDVTARIIDTNQAMGSGLGTLQVPLHCHLDSTKSYLVRISFPANLAIEPVPGTADKGAKISQFATSTARMDLKITSTAALRVQVNDKVAVRRDILAVSATGTPQKGFATEQGTVVEIDPDGIKVRLFKGLPEGKTSAITVGDLKDTACYWNTRDSA